MAEDYLTDYGKWYRLAYEHRYGKESEKEERHGFKEYRKPFKIYWSGELSVGVFESEGKFIGIACLVAKEVVDKESFVRRFGLSFEKGCSVEGCFLLPRPPTTLSVIQGGSDNDEQASMKLISIINLRNSSKELLLKLLEEWGLPFLEQF